MGRKAEDLIERVRVLNELEADDQAYKESSRWKVPEVVGYLLDVLGQRITAVGVGLADARPLRTWMDGKPIKHDNEVRLRLLFRVARAIALVYDAETARAFVRSSSPYLDDRSPLELIAEADDKRVIAAMRAFMDG